MAYTVVLGKSVDADYGPSLAEEVHVCSYVALKAVYVGTLVCEPETSGTHVRGPIIGETGGCSNTLRVMASLYANYVV